MYKKQDGMRGGPGSMNGGNGMSILNTNGPQQFDTPLINQVCYFLVFFRYFFCIIII